MGLLGSAKYFPILAKIILTRADRRQYWRGRQHPPLLLPPTGALDGDGGRGVPCCMSIFKKLQCCMSPSLIFYRHMSNSRHSHVSCHYLFLPPCRMSLSLMSHVKFKKSPCRHVKFRGQGPFLLCESTALNAHQRGSGRGWLPAPLLVRL